MTKLKNLEVEMLESNKKQFALQKIMDMVEPEETV